MIMRYLPIVITGAVCIYCYADEPLSLPDFVTIPEGTFTMGCCCPEEGGCLCEYLLHEVTVSSFEMMAHEVPQSFWIEVPGSNPSLFNGGLLPVERVTWQMCQEFISELNRRDSHFEYRLPSEGLNKKVKDIAWKAQEHLHRKYMRLLMNGKLKNT